MFGRLWDAIRRHKKLAIVGGLAAGTVAAVATHRLFRRPPRTYCFEGKVAVVTGGASGLGKCIVEELLEAGCETVYIWDINERVGVLTVRDFRRRFVDRLPEGDVAESEATEARPRVFFDRVDVSDPEEVEAAAERLLSQQDGAVDILVNNAGLFARKPFLESEIEEIKRVVGVNLLGPIWTCRIFLQHFLRRNSGYVVNIGSVASLAGFAGGQVYTATKMGIFGVTECCRMDCRKFSKTKGRPNDVHTLLVCPYYMTTPMFEGVESSTLEILHPEDVASQVVEAMRRFDDLLVIPEVMRMMVYSLRLIGSSRFSYLITDRLGTDKALDAVFRGEDERGSRGTEETEDDEGGTSEEG